MTYEEAFNLLVRRTCRCEKESTIECDKCSKAYDMIENVILNKDKYKWHDLRKNPTDLPPNGMRVECQHLPNITTDKKDLVVMHYFIDGEFVYNWDVDTDIKSSTFGQRYYGDVIAWREIDPFEEVTE